MRLLKRWTENGTLRTKNDTKCYPIEPESLAYYLYEVIYLGIALISSIVFWGHIKKEHIELHFNCQMYLGGG